MREYERLWSAVLHQAILDVGRYYAGQKVKNGTPSDGMRAVDWMLSESTGVGSLIWVCDILDLHPDTVRNSVFSKHG